jgi:TolB protein
LSFRTTAPAIAVTAVMTATAVAPIPLHAQWDNRYPLLEGFGHHVYVEGFEFPSIDAGILDPAPSPLGGALALASRGWIWVLDEETETARRLTRGGEMDSRPTWSPDARHIAFVRDDTHRTWIVVVEAESGREVRTIEDGPIVLDPAFSADGRHLYYTSSADGILRIRRVGMDAAQDPDEPVHVIDAERSRRLELRPQPHPDGERLVYLRKAGGDQVLLRGAAGEERTLIEGGIFSQSRPALSADGRTLAVNHPTHDGTWNLVLIELEDPANPVTLTTGLPLTPAWSADGRWIYFVEEGDGHTMKLRRIASAGGAPTDVVVREWDWGEPTGTVRIRTRMAGGVTDAPARLNVLDASGHPVLPKPGQSWFDGQHGRVFFYSPGVIEVVAPAGAVTVTAVSGLATPPVTATASLPAWGSVEVTIDLEPVWDAQAAGWYSGDHHFHLNYGGIRDLAPTDLIAMMRGEDLDVATPLLANLHNRFEDQELWGWRHDGPPIARFGQEVRAHFHGHIGMFGIESLFWPWIWGPGNPVYNRDDRSNAEAMRHAEEEGGIGVYVHPVAGRDPFSDLSSIPIELIPDGVLGDMHAIELACLWTDELGTAEVWYRLLNIGRPILAVAGTDVMKDYFRTMAIGTTRVYAHVGGAPGSGVLPPGALPSGVRPGGANPRDALTFDRYMAALKAGRSFVSTGPLLDFRVDGMGPGGVVDPARARWTVDIHSAVPYDRVELLVNGAVRWTGEGSGEPGTRSHSGSVELPEGGWVAIRAYSDGPVEWPAMNPSAFAHTAPVWIARVGSTEPAAERAAAQDLLRALDHARLLLDARYGDVDIPSIRERFDRARAELVLRIEG